MGGVAAAVQDHDNGYNAVAKIGAGLGVYHKTGDNSDDNITANETLTLTLTFDPQVILTSISLCAEGRNETGWSDGSTFLLNLERAVGCARVGNVLTKKVTVINSAKRSVRAR